MNTHGWFIILRFCKLSERILCSYVNKYINDIFKRLVPDINDLLSELIILYGDQFKKQLDTKRIDLEILKRNYPGCDVDVSILKSYLGFQQHLKLSDNEFNIGIAYSNDTDFKLTCKEMINGFYGRGRYTEYSLTILNLKEKMLPIFTIIDDYFEPVHYLLNCDKKHKYYNYVYVFYDDVIETKTTTRKPGIVCHIISFLNNFPQLFVEEAQSVEMVLASRYNSRKLFIINSLLET